MAKLFKKIAQQVNRYQNRTTTINGFIIYSAGNIGLITTENSYEAQWIKKNNSIE